MITERARVDTPYPCPPAKMVKTLTALVAPLGSFARVSAGFPGMVRDGRVLSAPHFVTIKGPGTATSPKLTEQWHNFDLAAALAASLGQPTKVVNDADLQG